MPLAIDPDEQGRGVPTQVDERRWVVICQDCGDWGGRADQYSEAVQKLRGPYASLEEAEGATVAHMMSTGPAPEK
jgi:hypothetical protein